MLGLATGKVDKTNLLAATEVLWAPALLLAFAGSEFVRKKPWMLFLLKLYIVDPPKKMLED